MRKIAIYITLLILLTLFLFRKNLNNPKAVFNLIANKFNKKVAKLVYAIFVLETANFTANIYKNTLGAGAIAIKKSYPFGFNEKTFKGVKTNGVYLSKNGNRYIKFNTLFDGFLFTANYITKDGLNNESLLKRVQLWGSAPGYCEKVIYIYKNLKF